jgi:Mlc titration factor MtfA (ptsG expression regulator)
MTGWFFSRSRAAVRIPLPMWDEAWAGLPFLARCAGTAADRLRELSEQLLSTKVMAGAGGLELTPAIQLHVALQACLPVLELGLDWYRGWHGIVVYPSEFLVQRQVHDEHGLVHEFDETLSGEAWDGGPVVVSWRQVQAPVADHPFNVVIHEFAHKLDQLGGGEPGRPPFERRLHPGLQARHWDEVRDDAFERFNAAVELVETGLPSDLDPESDLAAAYYARLPLDPYAAQDPGEFFAVSSEAFFVRPAALRDAFPDWYGMLSAFYRQAPLPG